MLILCPEPGRFVLPDGRPVDINTLLHSPIPPGSVVLVIPAEHCLVLEVDVAPHEVSHIRKLLPWKLEEQLIDSPDALHFAYRDMGGGKFGVVALRRALLETILADCKRLGFMPERVICEHELLDWQEGSWSLTFVELATYPYWLLRTSSHKAVASSSENLAALMQLLLESSASAPASICVFDCPETQKKCLQAMPESLVQLIHNTEHSARSSRLPAHSIDLLQGDFAPMLPWRSWWQQWRIAALLLLGLWLADLVFGSVSIVQLRQQIAQLDSEVETLFSSVLPGAQMVDPVLQLQRTLGARGGSKGLTELLARMEPVLASHQDFSVLSIEYDSSTGELQLQLGSRDIAAVESFLRALQLAGLNVELLGSSSDGNSSRSRLRVRS